MLCIDNRQFYTMIRLSQCFKNVTRKKTLHKTNPSQLNRCLSVLDLTFIGIGSMIGAGIFVVTGQVAKSIAGPSVIASFVLASVAASMSALCYVEFSTLVTRTGSAYIYTYASIGELWAFTIGWNMILEYVAMISTVSRALSSSIDSVFNCIIRNVTIEYVLADKTWDSPLLAEYPDFLAGVSILLAIILVSAGTKLSSNSNMICVSVLVMTLIVVIVASFVYGDVDNWVDDGGFIPYGVGGIIAGAATCFVTFSGFEVICISSEECLTPKKSIPLALVYSLGIVSLTYILIASALTYLVPYKDIVADAAFTAAFINEGVEWMAIVVTMGIILASFSTMLVALYFLSRLVYALSIDGLLMKTFATVSGTTQVPVTATVVFGLLSAVLAICFSYDVLVKFLSIGTLSAYTIVSCALIVSRYNPDQINHVSHVLSDDQSMGNHEQNNFTRTSDVEHETATIQSNDPAGTLMALFHGLPVLTNCKPGSAVSSAVLTFVVCSITAMLLIRNTRDYLHTSPGLVVIVCVFILVSLGSFVVIPMHHQTKRVRQLKVPCVPYLPALSILLNLLLMAELDMFTWTRFVLWITIGLFIYATYGYWNSKERCVRTDGDDSYLWLNEEEQDDHDYGSLNLEEVQTRDIGDKSSG